MSWLDASMKIQEQLDERMGLPSASSMDADVRCLGRRALIRKVDKLPASKDAERGTRIHAVMDGSDPKKLSPSEQTTVYIMQGEEDRIMEKYGFLQGSEIIRERRLWATTEFEEELYSGQIDTLYVQPERVAVVEYKSGFMFTVPILRNFQIKTQMALAYLEHGPKEAIATIIHPFHPDSMSETMSFGATELSLLPGIILGYLEQMTEDAPRTPNQISCHFCPAKKLCPEYQQSVAAVIPINGLAPVKARWELLSPIEKGERLEIFEMAEMIIKDERAAYKEMLKNDPGCIQGWKLGNTGKTATIPDMEAAKDLVRSRLGPDAADGIFEVSRKGLTAHFVAMGMSEAKAKVAADEILGPAIVYKAKEKSLVRE